jgi:hypothetical protein
MWTDINPDTDSGNAGRATPPSDLHTPLNNFIPLRNLFGQAFFYNLPATSISAVLIYLTQALRRAYAYKNQNFV